MGASLGGALALESSTVGRGCRAPSATMPAFQQVQHRALRIQPAPSTDLPVGCPRTYPCPSSQELGQEPGAVGDLELLVTPTL